MKTENTVWHEQNISKADRANLKNQQPCLLWYTGLSGSGKSTVANAVDAMLFERGCHSYLLDGDNVLTIIRSTCHRILYESIKKF